MAVVDSIKENRELCVASNKFLVIFYNHLEQVLFLLTQLVILARANVTPDNHVFKTKEVLGPK